MAAFENSKKGTIYKQWIIAIIAGIPVLTYGLQNGWMSPFIIVLQSENSPSGYPLSNNEISLIASGISTVAIGTAVIYGYIADAFGRRLSLILVVLPQILGFALKLVSAHPISLLISQVCCGIAGGGVFCVAPIYIKEIAQDSLRGILGSFGILLLSIGLLIMYAMGAYMNYYTVLWIVTWVPVLNLIALLVIPESPGFLVKKGKVEEAAKVMAWLRGVETDDKEVERDIMINKNEIAEYENLPPVSWKSILSEQTSRKGLGLSFLMITLLDMTGVYAILTYASVILRNAGVTFAPEAQALSFPALMTLGSLLSVLTIERFGRKPLIMISAILSGIPLAILGGLILVQRNGESLPSWLAVVCIGVCLYSSGQHMPLPYVVISEMFSMQLRTKILGLLVCYSWAVCAVQTMVFAPITEYFGMHTMFFGFSLFNFIGVIIVYVALPETKGKTLVQLSKELEGRRK
ncbi:facilitated trehalose transporter Tret1-2 homolog isoform X2 [Cydia pomonella]|uniref:facilitated trehalose transporter Tret1-2 homolog isoform X2 n=1 Tax=Cydia pomonella TaxID=82600 RepID=UPI002ADE056F|nr:facilitated trehalose transporter Tret1-2 homolog isoform X2 [Cydia pomonella]